MQVEIWSDIVCPWCYIGHRRFERALAAFEHRDAVTVRYRSFELDPAFPAGAPQPVLEMLAAKYRLSMAQASQAEAGVAARAAAEGLEFVADRAVGNTFDAHRLVQFAAASGRSGSLVSQLYQEYFGAGRPVFAAADLVPVAAAAGLDPDEAARMFEDGSYADAVRSDEAAAAALGITGVPFFALAGKYAVSGAQPVETLSRAMQAAWQRSTP